jgi:hypothetical protein
MRRIEYDLSIVICMAWSPPAYKTYTRSSCRSKGDPSENSISALESYCDYHHTPSALPSSIHMVDGGDRIDCRSVMPNQHKVLKEYVWKLARMPEELSLRDRCGKIWLMKTKRGPGDEPGPLFQIGSPGRTRTSDKVVNSHLLYQLSYRGSERHPVGGARLIANPDVRCQVFLSVPFHFLCRGNGHQTECPADPMKRS